MMTRPELPELPEQGESRATSPPLYEDIALQATGASALIGSEVIQSLWSGYGEIVRCALLFSETQTQTSVIVKHVRWPTAQNHPRGWNTGRSHERKLHSYRVESAWYSDWVARCDASCRVPRCIAVEARGDEVFIVMEDLDASGYDVRRTDLSAAELNACLAWLANFHATFMGAAPSGLWSTGTYWHLATRPDELEKLADAQLKAAAPAIDQRLSDSPFQTLVHGDAKVANFCFAHDGRVAAVDFQYVGAGCGMKDVAYFISSCLSEGECERRENELLNFYFETLENALLIHGSDVNFVQLESNWRALYPVAWTDFFRFLQGWSPEHWKIHRYSKRLAREVLAQL